MTKCPNCGKDLSFDYLDSVMDELSTIKMRGDQTFIAPCCKRDIVGRSDFGTYYIVKEQGREQETKEMIGAR
ncbi:hypothetical protein L2725_09700 [Shewanella corallii]|uniref:Uncharacterized protein n=1 Tax=Shewanella corallii TaxID=560080 RepID=A0ABT0N8B5_9GAMM|nr:hypothetical protein [Shewanella corallii]MCL2914062.1 hypothetical protein [Shewanella corallii]